MKKDLFYHKKSIPCPLRHLRSSRIGTLGINGVLLIDKPSGITSFKALESIKKAAGTKKVGHAGTLDKFATGLLLVCTGWCTRLIPLLVGLNKRYDATLHFGIETDTLDPEGAVIAEAPIPDYNTINQALQAFRGKIMQKPPLYSAIHVDGQRAYKIARKKTQVDLPARQVEIFQIGIRSCRLPEVDIEIFCSKGTYVRSIARDLGKASGSAAYLSKLRRTSVGNFTVHGAINPAHINLRKDITNAEEVLKSFLNIEMISVKESALQKVSHGMPINPDFLKSIPASDGYFGLCDNTDRLIAVAEKSCGKFTYRLVVPAEQKELLPVEPDD